MRLSADGARCIVPEGARRSAVGGRLLAALLGLVLCGAPAFGGIIELGRAGQKTKGSSTQMEVAGNQFTVVHIADQPIADVLQDFVDYYNTQGFTASIYSDPNDPNINAMSITDPNGGDVRPMTVQENDPNIHALGTRYSSPTFNPNRVIVAIPDAIAGNGNLQIQLTFRGGPVNTYTVTTAGKSLAQVVAEMVALLQPDVSAFAGMVPGFGTMNVFEIRPRNGAIIDGVRTDHTDTGASISGTGIFVEAPSANPPAPGPGGIPTLGEWGLITLAGLLAGAGVRILRRRGRNL